MTINPDSLAFDHVGHSRSEPEDQTDTNQFAIKMAGQTRAVHKRRKLRALRSRSKRR